MSIIDEMNESTNSLKTNLNKDDYKKGCCGDQEAYVTIFSPADKQSATLSSWLSLFLILLISISSQWQRYTLSFTYGFTGNAD